MLFLAISVVLAVTAADSVPVSGNDIKAAHADTAVKVESSYVYGGDDQYEDYYTEGGGGSAEDLDEYIYASDEEEDSVVDKFGEELTTPKVH